MFRKPLLEGICNLEVVISQDFKSYFVFIEIHNRLAKYLRNKGYQNKLEKYFQNKDDHK